MVTWAEFTAAIPDLASFAKQRFEGRIAYLATVRPDGSPRVHPVSPFIAGEHLFLYMEPTSPKRRDLNHDSRFAMHCAVEDNRGSLGEVLITGRALEVDDGKMREGAFSRAILIGYNPQERYVLFELKIESALSTVYEDGQPKRTKWKTPASTN